MTRWWLEDESEVLGEEYWRRWIDVLVRGATARATGNQKQTKANKNQLFRDVRGEHLSRRNNGPSTGDQASAPGRVVCLDNAVCIKGFAA